LKPRFEGELQCEPAADLLGRPVTSELALHDRAKSPVPSKLPIPWSAPLLACAVIGSVGRVPAVAVAVTVQFPFDR
jgi:hypothetical protein